MDAQQLRALRIVIDALKSGDFDESILIDYIGGGCFHLITALEEIYLQLKGSR